MICGLHVLVFFVMGEEMLGDMLEIREVIWGVEVGFVPLLIIGLTLLAFLGFVVFYLWPSISIVLNLKTTTRALVGVKNTGTQLDQDALSTIFSEKSGLKHLWSEYAETLHRQYGDVQGIEELVQIRATVPAEAFFNPQAVIDERISAEFFRHLPGIMTGAGIIGTFIGLIVGLQEFNMKLDDPAALSVGLEKLIESVKEAFVASGSAIAIAIIITLIEKLLYNWNIVVLVV